MLFLCYAMFLCLHLHKKSSEVSIKTRSTPASLSIQARTLSTQLYNGLFLTNCEIEWGVHSSIMQIFPSYRQFLISPNCLHQTDFIGHSFERKLFQRGVGEWGVGIFSIKGISERVGRWRGG